MLGGISFPSRVYLPMRQDPFAVSSVPPMIKWLLIANGLGFLFLMYAQEPVMQYFALWPLGEYPVRTSAGVGSVGFEIWQLLTYGFLHGSFGHLFFNMFGLWMFGRVVEQVWGGQRFLLYYLVCVVGAGLTQVLTLALLSVPLLKQRLRWQDGVGGIVCYAGVLVISTHGDVFTLHFTDSLGVVLALGSTVLWALYWIFNTREAGDPTSRVAFDQDLHGAVGKFQQL